MMFVRLSVCPSVWDGRALWPYGALYRGSKFMVGHSNVLHTLTPVPLHVHLLPTVFFQFHVEEKWCMDVQTKRKIKR